MYTTQKVFHYFYNFAISAKTSKTFLEVDDTEVDTYDNVNTERENAEKQADNEFMNKYYPSDLSIVSNDKLHLNLHADVHENGDNNSKWTILVHCYGGKSDLEYR